MLGAVGCLSNRYRHTLKKKKFNVISFNQLAGGFYLACENVWENVRPIIPRLRFFF